MFLFVVYALAVWYGAMHWRRRWPGAASVALGILGLLVVLYFHTRLNDWLGGAINLQVVRGILVPYIALVGSVGVFLAVLPRAHPSWGCPGCGYDLRGLDLEDSTTCPECGRSRMRVEPRTGAPLPHLPARRRGQGVPQDAGSDEERPQAGARRL